MRPRSLDLHLPQCSREACSQKGSHRHSPEVVFESPEAPCVCTQRPPQPLYSTTSAAAKHWLQQRHEKCTPIGVATCMGRKPSDTSKAQLGWAPGDPTHPINPMMPSRRHDQVAWVETEPKSARWHPHQRHDKQDNMWLRDAANLNGPRTKQGYRVTGQTVKSYYILGSTTKLASWTAPGATFLDSR